MTNKVRRATKLKSNFNRNPSIRVISCLFLVGANCIFIRSGIVVVVELSFARPLYMCFIWINGFHKTTPFFVYFLLLQLWNAVPTRIVVTILDIACVFSRMTVL